MGWGKGRIKVLYPFLFLSCSATISAAVGHQAKRIIKSELRKKVEKRTLASDFEISCALSLDFFDLKRKVCLVLLCHFERGKSYIDGKSRSKSESGSGSESECDWSCFGLVCVYHHLVSIDRHYAYIPSHLRFTLSKIMCFSLSKVVMHCSV